MRQRSLLKQTREYKSLKENCTHTQVNRRSFATNNAEDDPICHPDITLHPSYSSAGTKRVAFASRISIDYGFP